MGVLGFLDYWGGKLVFFYEALLEGGLLLIFVDICGVLGFESDALWLGVSVVVGCGGVLGLGLLLIGVVVLDFDHV